MAAQSCGCRTLSLFRPEFEYIDRTETSVRYLEHGWPTELCRWHSHPEYELHLIMATRGEAFIGDFIGPFEPGGLYLTGPDVPHNWVTMDRPETEPVALRDMVIQFSQDSIDHLTRAFPEFAQMRPMWDLARAGIRFEGFDPTFARGHFQRIRDTRGAERIAAFLRLLVRIDEHAEKRPLSVVRVVRPEGSAKQSRIATVIDHITQNYAEDLSLQQMAEMAGMSATAFSRNFQKATGSRFVEFVNRVRIAQACILLSATDEPVSGICFDTGFQNLANFNRRFLKMKQVTPSAYRASMRAGLMQKWKGTE